eukprot:scaffold1659_cov255-Pinguiococcus_pyrenoidosus.AAC.26
MVIKGITEATETTNEAAREAHDRALLHQLWHLLQALPNGKSPELPPSFVRPGRKFLSEGPLYGLPEVTKGRAKFKKNSRQEGNRPEYWSWLFSNILVVSTHKYGATRPPGLSEVEAAEYGSVTGKQRRSIVSTPTYLKYAIRYAAIGCSFHRLPYVEPFLNCLMFCTNDGTITLAANNKKEADNWEARIRESMRDADLERRHAGRGSTSTDGLDEPVKIHVHQHRAALRCVTQQLPVQMRRHPHPCSFSCLPLRASGCMCAYAHPFSDIDSMPTELLIGDDDVSLSEQGLIQPRRLQWWRAESSNVSNQQLLLSILGEFHYPTIRDYLRNPTSGLQVGGDMQHETRNQMIHAPTDVPDQRHGRGGRAVAAIFFRDADPCAAADHGAPATSD